MNADAPGEFEIIARYFSRPGTRKDVTLGIGDDAALLEVPAGHTLVAAMDTLVEGVHFPAGTSPAAIGHRALAVNLSDLAAMGADSAWALLSLSLPRSDAAWIGAFAEGFHTLADRFGVALVGGDTVQGPLVITVQILGTLPVGRGMTRSGAHPGDVLYVSGIPGEAAAGLDCLQQQRTGPAAAWLSQRFLYPEPRLSLGRSARNIATAAMDVSDGLLADIGKLCLASGCGAHIELESLPRSPAMTALFAPAVCERFALSGGDDYELLITVPPERIEEFERATAGQVTCTRIGAIVPKENSDPVICLRAGRAVSIEVRGFDHFAMRDSTQGPGGGVP
jgi:thiamine-monophosphate kinase